MFAGGKNMITKQHKQEDAYMDEFLRQHTVKTPNVPIPLNTVSIKTGKKPRPKA